MREFGLSLSLAIFLLGCFVAAIADPRPKTPRKPDATIQFIENKNQWQSAIRFRASTAAADMLLLKDRIQMVIKKPSDVNPKAKRSSLAPFHEGGNPMHASYVSSQLYEIAFLGGNKRPVIEAQDAAVTSYNYFIGNDRSKWASDAKGYGSIHYRKIYPGIDLSIYSDGDRIKQDWIVAPASNPYLIRAAYAGVESMRIDDGHLKINTQAGEVMEMKPVAYQIINNVKTIVSCHYVLQNEVVSFNFPEGFDSSAELVIDPILIFSGYSGSTFDNWGNSATYDSHGNLYSGGIVTKVRQGTDFPTTPGSYKKEFIGGHWDIGILKYDSAGSSLLYGTYVGGNGIESPQTMVVDGSGNLLIMGATSSSDFPVSNGSVFKGGDYTQPIEDCEYLEGSDIFVIKINERGTAFLNGTYLGGSRNDGINMFWGNSTSNFITRRPLAKNYGDETRSDIFVGSDQSVYIASTTSSTDFPVVNADPNATFHGDSLDAVVIKMKPDLSAIVWSRLLGGSKMDAAYSIKVDPANEVYVAGGTTSTDFYGTNGLYTAARGNIDGWVAHISADGQQIINATYIGTAAYDQVFNIDLNSDGDVFLFGQTKGQYPVSAGVYTNTNGGLFVHCLAKDLTASKFSTVVGGGNFTPDISPTAFLVSDCSTIYLGGWGGIIDNDCDIGISDGKFVLDCASPHRGYVGGDPRNLPVTPDAFQKTSEGDDFYFMVLSVDAKKLLFGSFFGASASLNHVDGGTSRFDKKGIVYQSVCAGCLGNSGFPAVNVPTARQKNNSANCNNAAFKLDLSTLKAIIQTNSPSLDQPNIRRVCLGDTIIFQNKSVGGELFKWDLGDNLALDRPDTAYLTHVYQQPGTYSVRLLAIDNGTCKGVDGASVTVVVVKRQGKAGSDVSICGGAAANLSASGATSYQWYDKDNVLVGDASTISVTPMETTAYTVKFTDSNGCHSSDTVNISVTPYVDTKFSLRRIFNCFDRPSVGIDLTTASLDSIFVDYGDGTPPEKPADAHVYRDDGIYAVSTFSTKRFCVYKTIVQVPIHTILAPNIIIPNGPDPLNKKFAIWYGGASASDAGISVSLRVYNRWGKSIYANDDYKGDWAGENVETGVYYYDALINNETTCKSWLHILK